MRRLSSALATLALIAACCAVPAMADEWHSEQPLSAGGEVPVALGKVYDIKFWAPNRGLLITAAGLWAYDGTSWHRLSTVCGGTGGRIAWAGPLDFWTISDQVAGQGGINASGARRSLCHFVNGAVVASYAQPIGLAGSYEQMNAAACLSPDDCWFAGERLPGTVNIGAFHLHWNGSELSPVPSLTEREPEAADPDRAVADLIVHEGALYESVRVDDNHVPGEPDDRPYVLHEIFPGTPPSFVPLFPTTPINYGPGNRPSLLAPLQLSGDEEELWAAAGASDCCSPVPVSVLRLGPAGFAPLNLSDPGGLLDPSARINSIAAEPGTEAAWIAYQRGGEEGNAGLFPARLALVHADGTVGEETVLPTPADDLSRKGRADRLACPAPGQCWLSTEVGWLFHLGGDLPLDEEPAMHQLITYRPPDGSTPILPLDTLPDEESEADRPPEEPPLQREPMAHRHGPRKLVLGVRQRVVGRTTVELYFTLAARARVQLVAKRGKKAVASTKRITLGKGEHMLRLRLNPKRWPTKLDLRAKRVKR